MARTNASDLTFFVQGVPRPQGSKKAIPTRGGKVNMVEVSKGLKPWREAVTLAARNAASKTGWASVPKGIPVVSRLRFYVPRGKTVTREYPSVINAGDLDKLCRAVLDALTKAGVWADDAQVVDLDAKVRYADVTKPGVRVTVRVKGGKG